MTKRGEILDSVKRTITQDRNNRHGEPENSFPMIAERWNNYIDSNHIGTGRNLQPSDVAEMMAIFKDVRFSIQPENPDNKHDQIGYLAIACELRSIENQVTPAPEPIFLSEVVPMKNNGYAPKHGRLFQPFMAEKFPDHAPFGKLLQDSMGQIWRRDSDGWTFIFG